MKRVKDITESNSFFRLVKNMLVGVLTLLYTSLFVAPTLAVVCLPFLFVGLYAKAFLVLFTVFIVAFTFCLICVILDTVDITIRKEK